MDDTAELPIDRLGLQVLPPEECWALIAATPVGRVALVDAGEPLIFPVTHGVHEHQVVFRTSGGTKLSSAEMNQPLAFEVDGWDPAVRQGWSVLVRGLGETVYEEAEVATLDALGTEPWLEAANRGTWVRILVDEISGRRLAG